jgi:broad specificity phosphatase PhoE
VKDPITDPLIPEPPPGEPSATSLWLIRHAEVEVKYQRIFGGRIDMELSPKGRLQANALADYLHGKQFDAIYASPMLRVQQTLAPLVAKNVPAPAILHDLREVDFGNWTGLGWEEVRTKFGVSAFTWLDQLEAAAIPGAESAQRLRVRVEFCLREILARHSGQEVAIACHGGVIRMLLSILLSMPLPAMAAFEIEYASLTNVRYLPGRAELHLLNFTPWRDLNP